MPPLAGFKTWLQTPTDENLASQEASPLANQFETIGGFQTIDPSYTATEIDATNQSSNENRELLNERGIRSSNISGSGVLQNSAIAKALELNWISQKLRWFQVVQQDNNNRTYKSRFKITNFSHSSAHDGTVNFTIELMSSGPISIA